MAALVLVVASPSASDARVTEVGLSRAGQAKLDEARAVTAPIYARIIQGLTQQDFDRLIGLLNRLYANLEDPD